VPVAELGEESTGEIPAPDPKEMDHEEYHGSFLHLRREKGLDLFQIFFLIQEPVLHDKGYPGKDLRVTLLDLLDDLLDDLLGGHPFTSLSFSPGGTDCSPFHMNILLHSI